MCLCLNSMTYNWPVRPSHACARNKTTASSYRFSCDDKLSRCVQIIVLCLAYVADATHTLFHCFTVHLCSTSLVRGEKIQLSYCSVTTCFINTTTESLHGQYGQDCHSSPFHSHSRNGSLCFKLPVPAVGPAARCPLCWI